MRREERRAAARSGAGENETRAGLSFRFSSLFLFSLFYLLPERQRVVLALVGRDGAALRPVEQVKGDRRVREVDGRPGGPGGVAKGRRRGEPGQQQDDGQESPGDGLHGWEREVV